MCTPSVANHSGWAWAAASQSATKQPRAARHVERMTALPRGVQLHYGQWLVTITTRRPAATCNTSLTMRALMPPLLPRPTTMAAPSRPCAAKPARRSGPGSADRLSSASTVIVGITACNAGVASIITESPIAVTGTVIGAVVVVAGRAAVVDGGRLLVEVGFGRARVEDVAEDDLSSDAHPNAAITRNSAMAARNRDITSTYRRPRISADAIARAA